MIAPAPSRPPDSRTEELADLLERLTVQVKAGESPDLDQLLREYPDHAEELRGLLPAIRLMADLSRSGDAHIDAGDARLSELGDFRILREAGRGGMGVVYEAEQVSLGRRVALKVLPFAATMDPRALVRFKNEAKAAASLRHEHIVHVYGVGCERGVHYYAMEFVDGQTIAELIHGLQAGVRPSAAATLPHTPDVPAAPTKPVAAISTERAPRGRAAHRQAAEWIAQAADALEHAHGLGIVHRDVKPGNLLLDAAGKVYVSDFGLARVGADAGLTASGDLLGTLRYMAPEQALARHGLADHRVDVYGLGATLYELLTGRPAVGGMDKADILRRIAFEDPVPPRKLDKTISAELETVALKCLTKEPGKRYASAGELAADLRRFLADKPIQAKPPGWLERAVKYGRRHRAFVGAAALVVLVLACSLGWIARDWQVRRMQAEGRIGEALVAAEPRLREGNPYDPELVAAARDAQTQLAISGVREPVRRQAERLIADVKMLEMLEFARLAASVVREDKFDDTASDSIYAEAFQAYGIDVFTLSPDEAATRVRSSAISLHLAAALDDWANARRTGGKTDWTTFLLLAKLADPQPMRCAIRDAAASRERTNYEKVLSQVSAPDVDRVALRLLAICDPDPHGKPAKLFETLLRSGQHRYPADFLLNELLFQTVARDPSRIDEAIGFCRASLALRPQSPGVHLNLGVALARSGRHVEAISCFREAIRLKPDYLDGHCNITSSLVDCGKFSEAEANAHRTIDLQPENAKSHFSLGYVLEKTGRHAQAALKFRRAIELEPGWAPACFLLAESLFHLGHFEEAEAYYLRAIKLNPRDATYSYQLGRALAVQEKFTQAQTYFRRAIELNPRYGMGHYGLGRTHQSLDAPTEALVAYRNAILAQPDDPDLRSWVGAQLRIMLKLDEAEALARAAIDRWPDDARGWESLGAALGDQAARGNATKLSEAVTALRRATNLKTGLVSAHFDLGKALILQGHAEDGVAEINKSIAIGRMHRYNAARAVVQAACGRSIGSEKFNEMERTGLRRQALVWLTAELGAWTESTDSPSEHPTIRRTMQHWQKDTDFAGVRDAAALAKLPEDEGDAWKKFWAEVDRLLKRTAEPMAAPKPPPMP